MSTAAQTGPAQRGELTAQLKSYARGLGFDLAGVCPAVRPSGIDRFGQWLAAGYAGDMAYLSSRGGAYEHPRHVLDGARSLMVLAMNYRTSEPAAAQPGQGRLSRYAWGADYHDLIRGRLNQLAGWLRCQLPQARVRGVVDTAPLLERELAQLAGLGWIGKNTLVLQRELGSWFFLAALLTDVELEYDQPHELDHCGTCRACIDACPTGAFVEPYVLDARRCISYLTIESRGAMPRELRPGVGDWLFGCDVCQEVCPWNHRAPATDEPDLAPGWGATALELAELFEMDDEQFRARFRHTPLWRPKRRGLLRNAAIVLGNQRRGESIGALARGLHDTEPLVRGAVAWALGQIGSDRAQSELARRLAIETDAEVREEISAALGQTAGGER